MNPTFPSSPHLKATDILEPPRKKSVPPPLPRLESAPPSSGLLRGGSPAGLDAGSFHPLILSPTPVDPPRLHPRSSTWAKLIAVGGVTLLVTAMLIRSHEGPRAPQALRASVPASQSVVPPRQFVELDEVLIEGVLYDKENIEGGVLR